MSGKSCKILRDFVWARYFLRVTFSAFKVFKAYLHPRMIFRKNIVFDIS